MYPAPPVTITRCNILSSKKKGVTTCNTLYLERLWEGGHDSLRKRPGAESGEMVEIETIYAPTAPIAIDFPPSKCRLWKAATGGPFQNLGDFGPLDARHPQSPVNLMLTCLRKYQRHHRHS